MYIDFFFAIFLYSKTQTQSNRRLKKIEEPFVGQRK